MINTAPPGHDQDQLQEMLTKAAAAGESLLQRAGSGTGEALRTNFLLVSETVEAQDGHLLRDQERSFLTSFRVSHALQPRSFLGRWFACVMSDSLNRAEESGAHKLTFMQPLYCARPSD